MDLLNENENLIIFLCKREGLNLEEFLAKQNLSKRLFRRLYRQKNIYVNGEFVRKDINLLKGDRVAIYMENEEDDTRPEAMDLDILYEDYDMLVLNKPANMVVHPTKSHQTNTLSNGIAHYFKENNIKRKVRFVNRLDMDTTGVLIVAKNPFAHQQLALQFAANSVTRKYLTLVDGIVEKDEGLIDLPIGRKEEESIRKVIDQNGQRALTRYIVRERFQNASLLDVEIYTGRSHQIRVHLNSIGHPIIGDSLYNTKSSYIKRQALHSYYLAVKKVREDKELKFTAPLPADISSLIDLFRS